jgi:outer membrane protein assembly factor BamA
MILKKLTNNRTQLFYFFASAVLFLFLSCFSCYAQLVKVNAIAVEGNKKTKTTTILRELSIKQGDLLPKSVLMEKIVTSKNNLTNTFLFVFNKVEYIEIDSQTVNILVTLKERFFFVPVPIIELADRNFNVWYFEQGHALNRINVGINFYCRNIFGCNHTLLLQSQLGYTQLFGVKYDMPYFNKKQSIGLQGFINYAQNKEVVIATIYNKQIFIRDFQNFLKRRVRIGAQAVLRKKINTKQILFLEYNVNNVSTAVSDSSNRYFLNGQSALNYLQLKYELDFDYRDLKAYPLKGRFYTLQAVYNLFNRPLMKNTKEIYVNLSHYLPVYKNLYFYNNIKLKYSPNELQPYAIQKGFGFGTDYLRGYEYYVMDGQSFGLIRNELKYLIFNKVLDLQYNKMPKIPIKVYAKTYCDNGYVVDKYYNENNTMNNRWLTGFGAGLDFYTYNEKVYRIEYSFNHLLENTLFFHMKANL